MIKLTASKEQLLNFKDHKKVMFETFFVIIFRCKVLNFLIVFFAFRTNTQTHVDYNYIYYQAIY